MAGAYYILELIVSRLKRHEREGVRGIACVVGTQGFRCSGRLETEGCFELRSRRGNRRQTVYPRRETGTLRFRNIDGIAWCFRGGS